MADTMKYCTAAVGLLWAALASLGPAGGNALFAAPPSAAPTTPHTLRRETPEAIAALLRPILERHDIPGMAAALVRGERPATIGTAGVRRRGSPQPIARADLFHVGSCTKAMTAMLCARLVEQGALSWNTTLAAAFPHQRPMMAPAFRTVTLEQLLTHRGGLPTDRKPRVVAGTTALFRHAGGRPRATRGTGLEYAPSGPARNGVSVF